MNPNVLTLQGNIPKCPICLGFLNDPIKSNNCTHIFCDICLTMWLQNKAECPLCRKKIDSTIRLYFPKDPKMKNEKINYLYYSVENLKIDNFMKINRNCLVCGKNAPEDDLILCDFCHYFETHFQCDPPTGLAFGKYYCKFCRKKFIESLKSHV